MFRLDALVLLRTSEVKSWETSIYSYVEACRGTVLLIAHVNITLMLKSLQILSLTHKIVSGLSPSFSAMAQEDVLT